MRGARMGDLERIAVRSRISARRLMEGGPAMFAMDAINHHIVIVGRMVKNPFVRNSLRVLVVSWFIPAKENMAGEERPWANIMAKAPFQPQVESEAIPAIARPMWATEE